MNLRNGAAIFNRKYVFMVLFLFWIASPVLAQDVEVVELRARLMRIELSENHLIVAEKKIELRSHEMNGKKVWDTLFFDEGGNEIEPQNLKLRSRLLIQGMSEEDSEIITAQEVRLLLD